MGDDLVRMDHGNCRVPPLTETEAGRQGRTLHIAVMQKAEGGWKEIGGGSCQEHGVGAWFRRNYDLASAREKTKIFVYAPSGGIKNLIYSYLEEIDAKEREAAAREARQRKGPRRSTAGGGA